MMQVSMVPRNHVESIWPQIEMYMQWAANYTYGRFTADDIKDSITQYDHDLWIAFDEEGIKGAVVTQFAVYPQKTYLDMVFTGGIQLDKWKDDMLALLKKFARDHDCAGIESAGRPGWVKIFKNDGHKIVFHVYELPVGD